MPQCILCSTAQSKLNPGDICLTCKNNGGLVIDENATLGEIPFKLFKIWYKEELLKTMKSEIEIYNISLKKEIKECVSEVEKVNI